MFKHCGATNCCSSSIRLMKCIEALMRLMLTAVPSTTSTYYPGCTYDVRRRVDTKRWAERQRA
eukprot:6187817-Pleurochrysis_carterae.AAC.5